MKYWAESIVPAEFNSLWVSLKFENIWLYDSFMFSLSKYVFDAVHSNSPQQMKMYTQILEHAKCWISRPESFSSSKK